MQAGERQPHLIIPKTALVTRQGRSYCFLVTGHRAKLVPVALGLPLNELVEIKSGLKEGDRVVLNPPASLKEGSRVRVKGP
jgi:multidrug efflux pump subunit AcrA (membrane-fusion protein)